MADYKGLNIRFRGDSTEATAALHTISSEAKAAQGNLAAIQQALGNTATNGKDLAQQLRSIQLQETGNAARAASDKTKAYDQVLVELNKRLGTAQEKLVTNRDALESLGSKWQAVGEVAAQHGGAIAQSMAEVVAAQEALAAADPGTDEHAAAFARLDEAVLRNVQNLSMETDALDAVFTKYGTLEGAVNAATETIKSTCSEIERTTQKMLVQQSSAQALAAEYARLEAASSTLGQAGESMQRWGSNLESIGDSLSSIGDRMTLVSAAVAMTFGRNVISSTEEFGNAISQLGGYLDIEGEQLDEMGDLALKWGKDTQFSATEAANAMNELAKGGMTQAQIAGGAMKATMDLAAAGGLDMASAAEVAVQAVKTFGLEAEDASAIADALAGAANKSTAEVSDLANGFKYVGGWASMAGWDINEVSGALALLSDHGLKGEMAGTALRNVMQRLAAPTDTAAKLMQQYGFSVRDSEGHMVKATEVVQRLNDVFGGLADEEKQNALNDIFGARALPAAIALMEEGSDALQGYIDSTTEVGYAGEMAQHRMGELGWALEYLRGEAETAAVNFGQALTPTIIGVANAIEDAMEWFNGLSETEQTNIANMALFVVAAGPVVSIVGHMASGIGSLVTGLGEGASAMATFFAQMQAGTGVVEALNIAHEGLAEMLTTGAYGLAIAATIGLIADLIGQYQAWVEHQNLVANATSGLTATLNQSIEGMESARDGMAELDMVVVDTAENIHAATEDALGSIADFGSTISDTLGSVASDSALVETYGSIIEELGNKGSISAEGLSELQNAVQQYNELTGAAVAITDEHTGQLNVNADAIDRVTDAYRANAEAKAYTDLYNEAIKKSIELQTELDRVTDEYNEIMSNGSNVAQLYFGDFAIYANQAGMAAHELENSQEELSNSLSSTEATIAILQERMDGLANKTFPTVQEALDDAGYGEVRFADLTQEQMDLVMSKFDGTAKSAIQAMHQIASVANSAYSEASGAMGGITSGTSSYTPSRSSSGGSSYDKEAYNALKKQFDAENRERQRAYDREYKELQKALQREYDQRKSAYSDEEDALEEANAKRLDELKSAHAAEESELSESNDALYQSRKKELDRELKLYQRENDRILKEAKSANSAQTKAFKDATSDRVAAIKAEYAARREALAANDGTSGIDSEIDRLKAETKAEKAEIDARKDAEKTAELQMAVDKAKTRRSRQDAEKALSDWLAQLAQKRREAEREAQIDQLEDRREAIKAETKVRQKALDEERDATIDSYKSQREAELAQITETQTARYDALKDSLDEQEELRKEANSAELATYKKSLDEQLASLVEKHRLEQEEMSAANDQQLELMRSAHSDALAELKDSQSEQLQSLKESQQDMTQAIKDAQQEQLDAIRGGMGDSVSAAGSGATGIADAYQRGISPMPSWSAKVVRSATDALKHGLDSGISGTKIGGKALYEAAANGLSPITEGFRSTARLASNGLAEQLMWNSPAVMRGSAALKGAAESGIDGIRGTFSNAGIAGGSSFSTSLGSPTNTSAARNAAGSIVSAAKTQLDTARAWTESSGYSAGINFANGISRSYSFVSSAARSVANAVSVYLHHSTPEEGPLRDDDTWGGDLVQNLIDGMRSKEPELVAQARELAGAIGGELDQGARYRVGYEIEPMARTVMNNVTEALRSGMPQQRGVTVVVQHMEVRKESDIDLVSERLNQRIEQVGRRGF